MKSVFLYVGLLVSLYGQAQTNPRSINAQLEKVEQTLDFFLKEEGFRSYEKITERERGVRPEHLYTILLTCVDWLREYERKKGLETIFNIGLSPKVYTPEDISRILRYLDKKLSMDAEKLNIKITRSIIKNEKTIRFNDLFYKAQNILSKLVRLNGGEHLSPSNVFSQLMRAIKDVESLLKPLGIIPKTHTIVYQNKIPKNVFENSLQIRKMLSDVYKSMGLHEGIEPEYRSDEAIKPADVYLQTQMILAEISGIKRLFDSLKRTYEPIRVSHKTPSDCFQLSAQLLDQLEQLKSADFYSKLQENE